ncbi:rhodanese-like domain-containing protein [Bacillus sp. JCM 19034]|uniref:rhodanese-like domain-containing protein n=1 Tax=Bacillus sp. JCM 19034 TaxID=1481928 RepID=UPI000785242B|nr:rhodanese-like domain-containing protein [Bacillus sp. JCM 19034]
MSYVIDGIEQLDAEELAVLLKEENDTIVIDVREYDEYDQAHIPGIPLIPMHTIPQHVEKLEKSQSYLFICRSGSRSQQVALYLKEQGFDDVKNFAGGMLTWDGEVESGLEWVVKDVKELDGNEG